MLLAMEDMTKQVQLEDQLKAYTKRLTEEVAKRTAELETRVKELERMNKIMVGRELRMAELKDKIKELEKIVNLMDGQGAVKKLREIIKL